MNLLYPIIPVEPRSEGDRSSAGEPLRLAAGAVRALDPARTSVLRVVAGSVWVTQQGNPFDVVLGAGERFVPARRGKIVVQVLSDATVQVG
jgi:hypothetical protein